MINQRSHQAGHQKKKIPAKIGKCIMLEEGDARPSDVAAAHSGAPASPATVACGCFTHWAATIHCVHMMHVMAQLHC